jgi:hypothetical protein
MSLKRDLDEALKHQRAAIGSLEKLFMIMLEKIGDTSDTMFIGIYGGQSLAPPDHKGLTAGHAYWVKIGDQWYRIEGIGADLKSPTAHNIRKTLIKELNLKKWPEDFS